MADLLDTLRGCEKWLSRYRSQGRSIGEENTKAGLIEPILEALGWDIRDPDEVHREYRRLPGDSPVDYALLLLRTPRLFVEAKGVGENLDDPKWAIQTITYATAAGVEWVVLTNGAEWRIYNAHAPVPIERKLFRTARLDDDLDSVMYSLSLLGKEHMGENRLAELWRAQFVDRQVHDVLRELFNPGEPAKELVSLVRKRVDTLALHDVRTSLARVRVSFEFPTVSDVVDEPRGGPLARRSSSEPTDSLASTDTTPRAEHAPWSVTDRERALSLADLIRFRELAPGAPIEATYLGRRYTAEVLPDGRVRFQENTFSSLSAAGAAAKNTVRGEGEHIGNTDGWKFWRVADRASGRQIPLKEIRRRAAHRDEG